MSFGGTVVWMRIILFHSGEEWWHTASATAPQTKACDECQCPAALDASDRRWGQTTAETSLYKKAHRQVPGTRAHTSGEAGPTARVMGASPLSWRPVWACFSLWALSWAQWGLCTAHIALYMQTRECYITISLYPCELHLSQVTNDKTNKKQQPKDDNTYTDLMYIVQNLSTLLHCQEKKQQWKIPRVFFEPK